MGDARKRALGRPPQGDGFDVDNYPKIGSYAFVRSIRGASSRGVLVMGTDAAPAAVPRKHRLGRLRVAVRAHYGALPSMAGRGLVKAGESPLGSFSVLGRSDRKPAPGSTAPRTEKPRGAPEGARAFALESAARKTTVAPSGAPLPELSGNAKRDTGVTRAVKNRACGALAKGCLTIESMKWRHTQCHHRACPGDPA